MLCWTTFLVPLSRTAAPIALEERGADGSHQVKVRVIASGVFDNPLSVAKTWAQTVANAGDPVPVGVGAIAERPPGATEITLLLMLGGNGTPSAAREAARERCVVLSRLDARVRDIHPVAAVAMAPEETMPIPGPVSPRA
jgi:hypothetical protein